MDILSVLARELGIKTVMFDVSVTPASDIIAAAFRYSHLVFASTTYNAGIFVCMEALLSDLVAHNIQNRTVRISLHYTCVFRRCIECHIPVGTHRSKIPGNVGAFPSVLFVESVKGFVDYIRLRRQW